MAEGEPLFFGFLFGFVIILALGILYNMGYLPPI